MFDQLVARCVPIRLERLKSDHPSGSNDKFSDTEREQENVSPTVRQGQEGSLPKHEMGLTKCQCRLTIFAVVRNAPVFQLWRVLAFHLPA